MAYKDPESSYTWMYVHYDNLADGILGREPSMNMAWS